MVALRSSTNLEPKWLQLGYLQILLLTVKFFHINFRQEEKSGCLGKFIWLYFLLQLLSLEIISWFLGWISQMELIIISSPLKHYIKKKNKTFLVNI